MGLTRTTNSEGSLEHIGRATGNAVSDNILDELLSETGYAVVTDEPHNAMDLDFSLPVPEYTIRSMSSVAEDAEPEEYRDPTMPHFRPNSGATLTSPGTSKTRGVSDEDRLADDDSEHESYTSLESEITTDKLRRWKMINAAEANAAQRGGWGRVSYKEFEEICKNQEHLGNRLDYLGSRMDFCIP
ncbi:EF hand domain-containing protein [Purpureocillium lavendulum]|uniref:EF hand domain-containing protein n=1 Tax=Purpureocillium lavendulum TaxID=1247861 RepID=A0AB34FGX7_9HYPO|nr:EF hand domain-containing protein [Purpureocillium lavendulum]